MDMDMVMDLHGHSTLHNIHMDTNMDMEYGSTDMDMDMEYGSTTDMDMDMEYGSTSTIWTWIWLHVHILSLYHTLDIKIDLFKLGTILFIIIQGFKISHPMLPGNGLFKIRILS